MLTREEQIKKNQMARMPKGKKAPVPLKPISDKKAAQLKEEKALRGEGDTQKEKWFKARRKEMTGTCQCGCAGKSSKHDEINFRSSIAHIFPKATFESVALHPMNWVERAFWGGCHSNADEGGLDKWPNMADWEDIKEKFFILAPLLTDAERGTKFYQKMEQLVYKKN